MKKFCISFAVFTFLLMSSQAFAQSEQEAWFFDSVRKGHEGIVIHLLNTGISIDVVDERNQPPLIVAVRANQTRTVKALLYHGANVNIGDPYGETALMWAVSMQNVELVSCLLKADANMDIRDDLGNTALMRAVMRFNEPIARILLSAGSNILLENRMRQNAFDVARKFGAYKIFELLLQKRYREESEIY